ncbi:Asp/Glu racemase [Phyllobacterium salinisoli]|uniref:Asp/Glu racemase n=1 Tax=Phyllobacterium salinisoli TaxID=1899321 RepID=A0A368JW28_9HYPH|nr:aspartate/glutamate racemase family protein [Phyllobacterium salinisoli]RCS21378.1 Asp/Glu racemase [Phyllobacterium salinisoli]
MHKPIAVFDAGIGSYAIVAEIQKRLPKQDIIYFADRASFPYGNKDRERLLAIMRKTIAFLESSAPSAIVVASNAPSIMMLDEIRQYSSVPLFGVFPPLQEALAASASGHVGIMGVRSLVDSKALRLFVQRHTAATNNVAMINASPMVELVETGSFLFSPAETQIAVTAFVDEVFRQYPTIDVLTLSSTHLPWLRPFFETARPGCRFLDPAEKIVADLGEGTTGTGQVRGMVTEGGNYDLETFRRMLAQIGVEIPLEPVGQF